MAIAYQTSIIVILLATSLVLILASIKISVSVQLDWSAFINATAWSSIPAISISFPFAWLCFWSVLGQRLRESGADKALQLSGYSRLSWFRLQYRLVIAYLVLMLCLLHLITPYGQRLVKLELHQAISMMDVSHLATSKVSMGKAIDSDHNLHLTVIQNDVAYALSNVSFNDQKEWSYQSGYVTPISGDWELQMGQGVIEWPLKPLKVEIDERHTFDLMASIDRWHLKGDNTTKAELELWKRWLHPIGTALLGGIAFVMTLGGRSSSFVAPGLFLGWWGGVRFLIKRRPFHCYLHLFLLFLSPLDLFCYVVVSDECFIQTAHQDVCVLGSDHDVVFVDDGDLRQLSRQGRTFLVQNVWVQYRTVFLQSVGLLYGVGIALFTLRMTQTDVVRDAALWVVGEAPHATCILGWCWIVLFTNPYV